MPVPTGFLRAQLNEIAPGVFYVPALMSNVYLIGRRGGPWLLVDAGMRGTAPWISHAASEAFGENVKPDAIVLTHGHFDHVGALDALLKDWDVPVYVHRLEAPYVTGKSDYPDPDPTVGGFMSQMSRLFPRSGIDLGDRVRLFPEDGIMPALQEWKVIHTPGHAPGHVSFFREHDRVLLAGDAFITINQDSAVDVITQRPQLRRPPTYLTTDWDAARQSVQKLARLEPNVAGTGHGLPLSGPNLAPHLHAFAEDFREPDHGRYVHQPVISDENGIVQVPPPVPDPVGTAITSVSIAAIAGLGIYMMNRAGSRRASERRLPFA